MNGIVLLNKPQGITSFQAVSRCKRIFSEKKAGHSGTLDPNAQGLMIIALGKYTKLLPYVVSGHKHYIATFSMGKKYDTQDKWGSVVSEKEYSLHSEEELKEACGHFRGHIMQIPPMYSALKKDGKKLYEYARKGIEVERNERPVEVSSLDVTCIGENLYRMDAIVSSGTYIRTLIEDYCAYLNEYGYMVSLIRTGIEHLSLNDAYSLEEIGERSLIVPLKVIDPAWTIIETENIKDVTNGKVISINSSEKRVILVHGSDILASYEKKEDGKYHCIRGLY